MNRIFDTIHDFLTVVVSLILIFTTVSIGYAIFAHAMGFRGPVWIIQFNEYAMLFATFLGASWLLSKGKHVSIELLVSRFKPRIQKVFEIIHSFMGIALSLILGYYGALTTIENFKRNVIHVQAVDIPMAYIIFVIPLGFFLLLIQFIRNLFLAINEINKNDSITSADS